MDLEQQLEVARTTVEQLTVRLIPTKQPIPETTKELVELLRQICDRGHRVIGGGASEGW